MRPPDHPRNLFEVAGCRYWTASVLPALVGSTLPFWLRPSGFSFQWLPAIEFLIATVLFHAGFSFLLARFGGRSKAGWSNLWLSGIAGVCILVGCLLGLDLNDGLKLHAGVPKSIFIVFGISTLFVGLLYVVPPFSFHRRETGLVVLAVGLGLVPVLGAYLVQVGDITRRVYLAAIPIVVSTGLWAWTCGLVSRSDDERAGRRTAAMAFPARVSGRYLTLLVMILLYGSLVMTVVVRSSLSPFALGGLLSFALALRIMTKVWHGYDNEANIRGTQKDAFLIHLFLCTIILASSFSEILLS